VQEYRVSVPFVVATTALLGTIITVTIRVATPW